MLYIFYMHFTLIVSVFMLSICDTEINKSINQSIKVANSAIITVRMSSFFVCFFFQKMLNACALCTGKVPSWD